MAKNSGKEDREGVLGNLSLFNENRNALAGQQVDLLEAVGREGSITAAARALGISYKTAWEKLDAINNLAAEPLVTRSAGGARGGGTRLTAYGKRIVQGFRAMEQEHGDYVRRLGKRVKSLNDIANFIEVGTMKTSARNQYRGVVKAVTGGAVNAEIRLAISESITLNVIVTEESRKQLGLKKGVGAVALVQSSSVILSRDAHIAVSARNKLGGTIQRITPGAVNTDVVVDLGDSKTISAMITNTSARDMKLKAGDEVCAFFKASSVILLVD